MRGITVIERFSSLDRRTVVAASLALQAGAAVTFAALAADTLPGPVVVLLPAALLGAQAALIAVIATSSRGGRLPTGLVTHLRKQSANARRSVMFDENTGLYHAWYLEMRLEEEATRCDRYGLEMALIVLRAGQVDLPQLSSGEWGSLAASVARSAARTVRTVDMTAALGPMEFAVCLVHAGHETALAVTRRLLEELSGLECSVGVVVYPSDCDDVSELVQLARLDAARPRLARAA